MKTITIFLLAVISQSVFGVTLKESKPNYVTQIMEPTGGSIKRPSDWFYKESHGGPSYTWVLSKEDPFKGPYVTGVRIQLLAKIREGTGKSPKEFVLDFVKQKKSEVDRVISSHNAKDQGIFSGVCFETEEGEYRIRYSAFWADGSDLAVFWIAGTKKDYWSNYSDVFDMMGDFLVIDMKRFEKTR